MTLSHHRLRHLAESNTSGACSTLQSSDQTDELLSLTLVDNSLISTAMPVLVTTLVTHYFGSNGTTLPITTVIVAFLIIVLTGITSEVANATYPECVMFPASFIIKPLLQISVPLITVVNAFAMGMLRLVCINTRKAPRQRMSTEEPRVSVLESDSFIPHKHYSTLLSLLGLDVITVDDVMTPCVRVELPDLSRPIEEVVQQLGTCYYNKLPVFGQDNDQAIGILHVRKALLLLGHTKLTHDDFRNLLAKPCFIPSDMLVFRQLWYFQENRRRLGLIVNGYGDMLGLVTSEDIIKEMISEFTTTFLSTGKLAWDKEGTYFVDTGMSLRDLNRCLGLSLPTGDLKTPNGLLLGELEEIPEATVGVKIVGCVMDIVQMDSQLIRTVWLHQPPQPKRS